MINFDMLIVYMLSEPVNSEKSDPPYCTLYRNGEWL